MKIKNLSVKNFRCFEEYSLELADRFTLLIGDNGAGKTAILDGLAVAAGSLLLGVSDVESRSILRDEIRHVQYTVGQTVTQERADETSVRAEGVVEGGKNISWQRSLRSGSGRTTREHAKVIQRVAQKMVEKVRQNEVVTLPVISYYGTCRLCRTLKDSEKRTEGKLSRFQGYKDCLNPASDQKSLFRWFKTSELAALQQQKRLHILEAVRTAIVKMIPDAINAFWDIGSDELVIDVVIQDTQQVIPFHLLSDGYRNVVGIAADIAYRMAVLNPHLESTVVASTPGIVLIDEIDLHLHPNWQRQVVDRLLQTFAKVQFVATTHSPFIIQSLYGKNDVVLWDLTKRQSLSVESKSLEDIAEDKQGVEIPQQSHRFLEMMAVAEEYYKLLQQTKQTDDNAQVAELRSRLDKLSMPYSDDPAFQAFLKIERIAKKIDQE